LWRTKTGPDGRAMLSKSGKPIHYQTEVDKGALPKGGLTVVSEPKNIKGAIVLDKDNEPVLTAGNVNSEKLKEIVANLQANYNSWKQEYAMQQVRSCLEQIESGSPIKRAMAENRLRRKYPQVYRIYMESEEQCY